MVVLSVLRASQAGVRGLSGPLFRSQPLLKPSQIKSLVPTCTRRMSDKRTMKILPSRYEWEKWKDDTNFYLLLGLIPLGALITFVNIFIGRAELVDIPEGYEPKHWEYYRHPIERWFSRYVYDHPQADYEKLLHMVVNTDEKAKARQLEKKVKKLMSERGDYKGWYYEPAKVHKVYVARVNVDEETEWEGTR